MLAIRLGPQWRQPLAMITKCAIGTRLAIRLAGEVIASPLITESVTDRSIHLGGPDRQKLARFADAISIGP